MIRIDSLWLAAQPMDMRAGADRLLASVVQVFGSAQAHHGYLFVDALVLGLPWQRLEQAQRITHM